MPHVHALIGDARSHFYRRMLPVWTTVLTLTAAGCSVWAAIGQRSDRANAYLAVAIFLAILMAVSWDVAFMLRRLERDLAAQQRQP